MLRPGVIAVVVEVLIRFVLLSPMIGQPFPVVGLVVVLLKPGEVFADESIM